MAVVVTSGLDLEHAFMAPCVPMSLLSVASGLEPELGPHP